MNIEAAQFVIAAGLTEQTILSYKTLKGSTLSSAEGNVLRAMRGVADQFRELSTDKTPPEIRTDAAFRTLISILETASEEKDSTGFLGLGDKVSPALCSNALPNLIGELRGLIAQKPGDSSGAGAASIDDRFAQLQGQIDQQRAEQDRQARVQKEQQKIAGAFIGEMMKLLDPATAKKVLSINGAAEFCAYNGQNHGALLQLTAGDGSGLTVAANPAPVVGAVAPALQSLPSKYDIDTAKAEVRGTAERDRKKIRDALPAVTFAAIWELVDFSKGAQSSGGGAALFDQGGGKTETTDQDFANELIHALITDSLSPTYTSSKVWADKFEELVAGCDNKPSGSEIAALIEGIKGFDYSTNLPPLGVDRSQLVGSVTPTGLWLPKPETQAPRPG